jgi:hypothetical protein
VSRIVIVTLKEVIKLVFKKVEYECGQIHLTQGRERSQGLWNSVLDLRVL